MSIEDNENIYVLNDDEKDPDDSPKNYASYIYEEDEEEENDQIEQKEDRGKVSAFGLMFKIMFSPVEGWKSLRRKNLSVESLQSNCFYPLLALLALGNFADYIYSVNVNLSEVITKAVVAFVSFFFSYFSLPVLLSIILPKEMAEKITAKFGKAYFIIGLSTLALFSTITTLLPMIWPILIFLPIWTLYILFKGLRFFQFKENQNIKFYILASVGVIGMPLLIDWILNLILPY